MGRGTRWTQVFTQARAWGMLVLAVFYLNFLVVHLATELHSHGAEHSHTEPDHHSEDHDHAPHDVSEHSLDVALRGVDVFHGPIVAVLAEKFVLSPPLSFKWRQPLFERERPPGESPPDPQQPRAPPLA